MARGVNGMCPDGACWPWPMISSTCWRTASSEMPSDSRALAATPSPSWIRPEQDVLGADVVVVEHPGLFLGQDDYATRAVGKPFEHFNQLLLARQCLITKHKWGALARLQSTWAVGRALGVKQRTSGLALMTSQRARPRQDARQASVLRSQRTPHDPTRGSPTSARTGRPATASTAARRSRNPESNSRTDCDRLESVPDSITERDRRNQFAEL